MRTPSSQKCRLDLAPPLADRFILGMVPIDCSPALLLMPFGCHLTVDTLPACPPSTLRVQPCDCPRMTRGQVGALRLTCTTLAFATSRRFIPAHSKTRPFCGSFGCLIVIRATESMGLRV